MVLMVHVRARRLGRVMEEKAEAQGLLEASLQKISSTQRALGNGEVEEHRHIDAMLAFIRGHLGIDPAAAASVRTRLPLERPSSLDALPVLHVCAECPLLQYGVRGARALS